MGTVCTSYKTREHLALLLLWFLYHYCVYLYWWLSDFCEPSTCVLFGCSVAKEGTGGGKKTPRAIILNYYHIKCAAE